MSIERSETDRWPPRPSLSSAFFKAHGLGNDYLVLEEGDDWIATPGAVARVCEPHRGVGSDGVVALLRDRTGDVYRLRMFNPDGGEFERSGNGLRVLASFLARRGDAPPYRVQVAGEEVVMRVHGSRAGLHDVSVELGSARTGPDAVRLAPEALSPDGTLPGPLGEPLRVVPVSVGNPHVVVLDEGVTEKRLAELGPFLVRHPAFAHGTNVQLAEATPEGGGRALIWERGVGRTSASGTSACAVAVALVMSGRARVGDVAISMPGGDLSVNVSPELDIVLRGPVEEVCAGVLSEPLLL
jgi:diaminopimelate epimerase